MAGGLALAATSCMGGAEPEQHTALLLLDQEAREAGVAIEGMDVTARALPIAVPTDRPLTLVDGRGTRHLDVAEGDVVLVRGADATIEWHAAGEDVDPDRITVRTTPDVAAELAELLGAALIERDDGLVEIEAPGVLSAAASAPAIDGVIEAELVPLEAVSAVREVAARPALARGHAGLAAPARAPEAVAAAALASAPAVLSVHDLAYRDLLPAVSCGDGVAGTWIARRHFPNENDWYFFTMQIERTRRSELRGTIRAHSWVGGATDVNSARACEVGGEQWVVQMPAKGQVQGDRIAFGGTSWELAEHTCGWAPGPGQYNLDQFSGAIAPDGEAVWQNDDGGRMVAEPFEFRRISCDPSAPIGR